jgi:hypothetical protein
MDNPLDMKVGDIWLDADDDYNLILSDVFDNGGGDLCVTHMELRTGHIWQETCIWVAGDEDDGPYFVEKVA